MTAAQFFHGKATKAAVSAGWVALTRGCWAPSAWAGNSFWGHIFQGTEFHPPSSVQAQGSMQDTCPARGTPKLGAQHSKGGGRRTRCQPVPPCFTYSFTGGGAGKGAGALPCLSAFCLSSNDLGSAIPFLSHGCPIPFYKLFLKLGQRSLWDSEFINCLCAKSTCI